MDEHVVVVNMAVNNKEVSSYKQMSFVDYCQ